MSSQRGAQGLAHRFLTVFHDGGDNARARSGGFAVTVRGDELLPQLTEGSIERGDEFRSDLSHGLRLATQFREVVSIADILPAERLTIALDGLATTPQLDLGHADTGDDVQAGPG